MSIKGHLQRGSVLGNNMGKPFTSRQQPIMNNRRSIWQLLQSTFESLMAWMIWAAARNEGRSEADVDKQETAFV